MNAAPAGQFPALKQPTPLLRSHPGLRFSLRHQELPQEPTMNPQGISRRDVLQTLGLTVAAGGTGLLSAATAEAAPRVAEEGKLPDDARLGALKDLNGYFPFTPSATPAEWARRREYVKRQMQVACSLWPMPERPPVSATVHGRVEREGYTVDRVYFEASPGLLVTGSLYRPTGFEGRRPAILCPHGHWGGGRFHDHGEATVQNEIKAGAEKFPVGGRHPLQARCVQLARMGCIVFLYDMQGYADDGSFSFELIHRFGKQRPELSSPERWGMFSAQSELRLINALGLQTWNSIRAVDWISSLPDVDTTRLGVTGASGGGTQTFMLAAIDDRITAAFPAVMVSTAMQGGCTCENATYLRINTGNIEFAAMVAPRPIAMSGANDWTVEIEKKGLPELRQHYAMMQAADKVSAKWFDFPHNYNAQSRAMMYAFFNEALNLGQTNIEEKDYIPLTQAEATVFDADHPKPALTEDSEVNILKAIADESDRQITALTPHDEASLKKYRQVIGGALEVMIGRSLPAKEDVEYEKIDEFEHDGYTVYTSWLRVPKHHEAVPTVFLHPADWNSQVIVVVTQHGKAALFGEDGKPMPDVMKVLKAGFAVAASDLLYQGEYLTDGQPQTQARTVNNPREFAGYTYGYNHPLFSQRVHDVLTLLSFVKNHKTQPKHVHLVGMSGPAAAIATAACALARDTVSSLAIDTLGFRFGQITDIRDVNLLPGAVKYGDLPGLLALCEPVPLWVAGEKAANLEVVAAARKASGSDRKINVYTGTEEHTGSLVADWLITGGWTSGG